MERAPAGACCHCGATLADILIREHGNLRLAKCESCGCIADEYWSHEALLVLIDILLHRPPAYRHLLYNMGICLSDRHRRAVLTGAAVALAGCDAVHQQSLFAFVSAAGVGDTGSQAAYSQNGGNPLLLSHVGDFAWLLVSSVLQFVCFTAVAAQAAHALAAKDSSEAEDQHFITSNQQRAWINVGTALLLSSIGKGLVLLRLVWLYPNSFGAAVELFTLSCNFVALRVAANTSSQHAVLSLLLAATARAVVASILGMPGEELRGRAEA